MKKNSIKTVVAVSIGAALFFVLGRFAVIPTAIPNTYINIQYAVLGLFAVLFGPAAGALIGLIGHALIDISMYGSAWWSWVIASAAVGAFAGFAGKKIALAEGSFGKKEIILFAVANIVANVLAWVVVAPVLDILIYSEPVNKVFVQGLFAAASNSVTAVIVGVLLGVAYSKTIAGKGTLDRE